MNVVRQREFGGPEVLEFVELADPVPAEGEVLVRIHAAAINHYDLLSRKGINPAMPLPRVPGMDATGVVVENRSHRLDLSPGTPVVILGERMGNGGLVGGYATHVAIPEEEVFPFPERVDPVAVACLGISYLTAWYALTRRSRMREPGMLLIPGVGGGVASAALQLARMLGHRVFATTSSPEKCAAAVALGAEACFDYRVQDVVSVVKEATGGVDEVLNAVGGASIQQGLGCLRHGGRLLTIGTAYGREFTFDGYDFLCRELELVGVNISFHTPCERHALLVELCAFIAEGRLRVLVDRTFPLAEAAAAHRYVADHQHFGKVVLLP